MISKTVKLQADRQLPPALIVVIAVLFLSAGVSALRQITTPAARAAQPTPALPVIVIATPAPTVAAQSHTKLAERAQTPPLMPIVTVLEPPPAPVSAPPSDEPPPVQQPAQAEVAAFGLKETTPQIDALNDPQQNGGNVAPEGCPFPIINGVCGNGQKAPKGEHGNKQK